MPTPFVIPVSTAGMLASVACVVAGGPLFAGGLRALRLRRLLSGLLPSASAPGSLGFVRLAGHVALESPLFSPLSQRPCAGYQLEVRAADGSVAGRIGERRGFKLVSEGCDAFVEAAGGEWDMPVTAERAVAAGEQVSANMAALLDRDVTLRWLRAHRAPMRIVERSVEAGTHVEVVGHARAAEADMIIEDGEMLAATGTDGAAFAAALSRTAERPSLRIAAADPLDLHVIATGEADPLRLAPPRWRTLGAVLGPILSLAGLLYLAHAAESTIAGRF